MLSKSLILPFATLLLLASLSACAPLPPPTGTPAVTVAAPAEQSAPTADVGPATTLVAPASPTPVIPDPKTDPAAALLYASSAKLFNTASFTYTMSMNMAPGDDATAKALGAQADLLKNAATTVKGSGALEVTDPAALKSKMRMDMDVSAAGQQMGLQMIVIDQSAWFKQAGQDKWQKAEGKQVASVAPGMSPEQMLKDFKNAADVQWVEDVTVGGEQLSHLRFTLDPSKVDVGSLTGGASGTASLTPEQIQAMFKDMRPVVDVWLAKPTLELRGEKMQLEWVMPLPDAGTIKDAKLKVAAVMDMQFSQVNQPVTIEPPAE